MRLGARASTFCWRSSQAANRLRFVSNQRWWCGRALPTHPVRTDPLPSRTAAGTVSCSPTNTGGQMVAIAVIGVGSVGKALGHGLAATGHDVTFGVRDPNHPKREGLGRVVEPSEAVPNADVVILAIPVGRGAHRCSPIEGPARTGRDRRDRRRIHEPVPEGFATMAELVGSIVGEGVPLVKAFNTVDTMYMGDARTDQGGVFLPIAGDKDGIDTVLSLAIDLGFNAVSLGGRSHFEMIESYARMCVHLGGRRNWPRHYAFTVVSRD